MSKIEIFLIVGASLMPILAFLFMLPKTFKNKKKNPPKTTEYVSEEKPTEIKENSKPKIEESPIKQSLSNELSESTQTEYKKVEFSNPFDNDFRNEISGYREYMERKREQLTRPSRVELPKDFKDLSESYFEHRRRRREQKQQEQDDDVLNLDVQALLIAGILDRKF